MNLLFRTSLNKKFPFLFSTSAYTMVAHNPELSYKEVKAKVRTFVSCFSSSLLQEIIKSILVSQFFSSNYGLCNYILLRLILILLLILFFSYFMFYFHYQILRRAHNTTRNILLTITTIGTLFLAAYCKARNIPVQCVIRFFSKFLTLAK